MGDEISPKMEFNHNYTKWDYYNWFKYEDTRGFYNLSTNPKNQTSFF